MKTIYRQLGDIRKSAFAAEERSGYSRNNTGIPESAFPFVQNINAINLPGSTPFPNIPLVEGVILTELGGYVITENGMYIAKEQDF